MKSNLTRRSFLKSAGVVSAAAAAGFPAIVPSSVLGRAAPSNKIHLAMFGCGNQGTGDMMNHAAQDDARFIMVCDPFKARRDAAAARLNKQYGDTSVVATADYREIMARHDIDAIVVATPDHWHVPLALAAAATGKDAYVEKPLALSLEWAKRLREAHRRHGCVFQYGTMQRSSANFRYACEVAINGYLGKIKHVDVWSIDGTRAKEWMKPESLVPEPVPPDIDYEIWQGPAPERPYNHYRVNREGSFHTYDYSIGFLGGWGSHPLDIAHWGLGKDETGPVEARGTGKIPTGGMYSTVYDWDVHCKYEDGVTMRFMAYSAATPVIARYRKRLNDHGTTFFGEEGWLSVDRGGVEASDPRFLSIKIKPSDKHLTVSRNHARNFLDAVRTRQPAICPLECAIRSDTVSHLADLTVRLGRTIRWDPKKEVAIDDEQANRMLHRPMRPPHIF